MKRSEVKWNDIHFQLIVWNNWWAVMILVKIVENLRICIRTNARSVRKSSEYRSARMNLRVWNERWSYNFLRNSRKSASQRWNIGSSCASHFETLTGYILSECEYMKWKEMHRYMDPGYWRRNREMNSSETCSKVKRRFIFAATAVLCWHTKHCTPKWADLNFRVYHSAASQCDFFYARGEEGHTERYNVRDRENIQSV